MKSVKILSRIENGKCRRNLTLIKSAFAKFEGKEIEITIKRKYKERTLPQNAFYWGVTIPFFQNLFLEEWGEIKSVDETHEILKSVCNFKEIVNESTGEIIRMPLTTTTKTTTEFGEYLNKIIIFADEFLNIIIPPAGEQSKLSY